MKKWAVAVGIFSILVGIILTPSYNVQQRVDLSEEVDNQPNKWSVSGLFEEHEKLGLYFVQPKDWSFGPYPDLGEPSYSKHLMINVTNVAAENFTLFKVILAVPRTEIPPQAPYAFTLTIYDVEVEHDGGLITETHPKWTSQLIALGTAKNSSEYLVETKLIPESVIDEYGQIKFVSPPLQLVLYKVSTKYVSPYTFLLPLGLTLIVCGTVLLAWGVRSKPRRLIKKSRRFSPNV